MNLFCPRCGAELGEQVKGQWFEVPVQCPECKLTLAEPPLTLAQGPAEDEVEYSLEGWAVPERAAATAALTGVDIPYRWEAGLVLVVPAVAEDEVDLLLEELEAPDEAAETEAPVDGEGDEADGGEEAQRAMAELFVVADRLQHTPGDAQLGLELVDLAAVVKDSAPPYGIERPVWRRIQALADAAVSSLEDGADDDAVAADARALRDFLRDLV